MATAAACAHGAGNAPAGAGSIGYVRMDDLVSKDPLYGQLSKYDQDIAALQLRSVGGQQVAQSGAGIQKEQAELQRELQNAANRTRDLLKAKQTEYQDRENAAIKAALAAAGAPVGPGAGEVASQIQATSNQQTQAVARQAQASLDTFRKETIAQDVAQVNSLRASLGERADRTYRAQAESLHEKESTYALQQASADAAQRLSLKTKLSNLPLDDASRKDITDQLDALDRKEADGLAALRNRDQATLATLQQQLRAQTNTEYTKEVVAIHDRTTAKLKDRTNQTRDTLVKQLGGQVTAQGSVTVGSPALTPDMKAKLQDLHKQYQDQFQKDADATVKAFYKTRDDLTRRFAELHGVDAGAQGDVARQINDLRKQRQDLYDEILAQVGREVKLVAGRRGVSVVFSVIVAPAAGVDLTDDTEKDIESLHE
jgi:outer membrane OmpH-like protein